MCGNFIHIMVRIQGKTFVGFGCKDKNAYPASGFFTHSKAWDEGGWWRAGPAGSLQGGTLKRKKKHLRAEIQGQLIGTPHG